MKNLCYFYKLKARFLNSLKHHFAVSLERFIDIIKRSGDTPDSLEHQFAVGSERIIDIVKHNEGLKSLDD